MKSEPNYSGYPTRQCRTLLECRICGQPIKLGETYCDGGYSRRAHLSCVNDSAAAKKVAEEVALAPHIAAAKEREEKLADLMKKMKMYAHSDLPNGGDPIALLAARDDCKLWLSELAAILGGGE